MNSQGFPRLQVIPKMHKASLASHLQQRRAANSVTANLTDSTHKQTFASMFANVQIVGPQTTRSPAGLLLISATGLVVPWMAGRAPVLLPRIGVTQHIHVLETRYSHSQGPVSSCISLLALPSPCLLPLLPLLLELQFLTHTSHTCSSCQLHCCHRCWHRLQHCWSRQRHCMRFKCP